MALVAFLLGCSAGAVLALLAARRRAMRAIPPGAEASAAASAPANGTPVEAAPRGETLQLAGLVHELRTPLAAIRAYAELLGGAGADPAFLEEASSILVEEAERLDALIGLHLDLVRAPQQRAPSSAHAAPPPMCDAAAEARAACDLLRPLAARSSVAIELDLPGEPLFARAERALLRQVLANLLGNALKHARGGTRILVRARREEDEVRVEVADDGAGLPASSRSRLFEPFARGEQAIGPTAEGHGLGLWVARELARSSGGELLVLPPDAELGGARFELELPAATAAPRSATLGGA